MRLFAIRDYRHLFSAQVIALFGTGLATVALALPAYDLAGPKAGAVLGTALTIKMVLYVIIAPLAAAYVDRIPRRAFLVTLDVLRTGVVLGLPFVTEIWQIYVLRFGLDRCQVWTVAPRVGSPAPVRVAVFGLRRPGRALRTRVEGSGRSVNEQDSPMRARVSPRPWRRASLMWEL